jgi:hypothetical protein
VAESRNREMYALAYERLNPLNERPLAERIIKLADLGFTINAQPTETPPLSGSQ